MAKISACLIVRDAADTLGPCLESIRPHVDEIVVVDTGSTDDSPAIAQKHADKWELYTGCNVHPGTGQEEARIWNFADARNKSFALATHETVFWIDADDIIVGAEHLRSIADTLPDGQSVALIPYEYSYADAELTLPNCIHWRERLIRPAKDFVWSTPCHEVCQPRAGGAATVPAGHVRILHRAQKSKAPREVGRNMRILEEYLRHAGESDIRAMYYMGVEYARHQRFGRARETLRRYTEISGWSDEKCLGELELGRIHLQEGDCKSALQWATQALTTKSWPDPYWLLVKIFCRMADEGKASEREYNMRRALAWAERGRPLPDAETVLFYNPLERHETERFVARILGMMGDIEGAAEACRRGLKGLPGDPDLMEQLRGYEAIRLGRDLDQILGRLVHLGKINERVQQAVVGLLSGQLQLDAPAANDNQPNPFARIGTGDAVDTEALPPVPDGKLDIVIFTGPAFEDWTPATIAETGIGGSETMAWEMARGLARLGHRVRHYGWCKPEQEGVFDGVHWYDAARYRDIKCDVLVVSRYADGVQCVGGVKARARVFWCHDVHAGAALTPEHAGRFDRFLCLSEWHKAFFCQTYAFIDPERVQVTRNGIDLGLFALGPTKDGFDENNMPVVVQAKRTPTRAVYSSSPDRGLQTALDLWPLIRAEVPDAELHVYYGFAGLRAIQPALAVALEAKAKATEGVVLHGRVHPRELATEFLRSGVWFYPTWFTETSCITAMQAQVAGLRIVTSPIAALNETVGHRGVLIDGAPGPIDMQTQGFVLSEPSAEYRSACVRAVVKALTDPSGEGERGAVQYYAARQFGLPGLCEEWSRMLTELCASVDSERVSRFYVAPEFEKAGREVDEGDEVAA